MLEKDILYYFYVTTKMLSMKCILYCGKNLNFNKTEPKYKLIMLCLDLLVRAINCLGKLISDSCLSCTCGCCVDTVIAWMS